MRTCLYPYVGPKEIADRARTSASALRVDSPADVLAWMKKTNQKLDFSHSVTATFVVDRLGGLWIADRRSEHVACARGQPVQSAGEITFSVAGDKEISVVWVTNQSTGYCPEPESYPAVKKALGRVGIEGPLNFNQEFVFRRCMKCGSINIVKDGIFECAVCSTFLPADWNLTNRRALDE